MTWQFKTDRPIYLQLMESVELGIVSGEYPPGSKLPAVRDLAAQAGVNPNTMQKALGELERDGLLRSQRTAGRFITEDESMIQSIKTALAKEQVQSFFEAMRALGFDKEAAMQLLQESTEEGEG